MEHADDKPADEVGTRAALTPLSGIPLRLFVALLVLPTVSATIFIVRTGHHARRRLQAAVLACQATADRQGAGLSYRSVRARQ